MVIKEPVELPSLNIQRQRGYRLINSKYPPIALFDDVADEEEFETLYELQALTNPRLQNSAGLPGFLPAGEIPFGITGCSYAVAPFTHVNPLGSRFSDGSYGMLYIADDMTTALTEVTYHQEHYWQQVEGLKYDRMVMRSLVFIFDPEPATDALVLPFSHPIYDAHSYNAARALGLSLKNQGCRSLRYRSVRRADSVCWGLFTPKGVKSVLQSAHYEFIWDGKKIDKIDRIVSAHTLK
ncbi:RES family NAD+ phosphorylase [Sodalis sp. dw_96]|uniref:RES family NAD+ phosphorylase n=1 Tax=Sodalis sp. dw_96 TaxID=2719794 RepID=UPI001BD3230B|nr:RES family NAD+ phosphorylase [Sodalis sp. dw_96]